MSQQHPSPVPTVSVSTSGATNEHVRAKAPKWLKDAASAADESTRGAARSMVMQLSVANARKLAPWLEAETDRLSGGDGASADDRRLARRLRTVAARVPKAIERAERPAVPAFPADAKGDSDGGSDGVAA